ncbi:hypothetical protein CONPUDRAFT_140847 [Coniophora puteana RWD-64-598 SS2]|uniref:BAH-domain-containing protein n=1 Tax=Coniophora puteana (strain RWD-64-598) TaxID=741705 RepID=A0A5M3N5M4_CONPW|nr:uncharacterized protein CONPUDRAFT_140847 [Coniophora puteana RWD-64-598 SS2]EIW86165.1 hypothetical protein CONPUDRAFT_140847 [Coniophora puteana RWD-64-598 SS2]
MPLTPAQKAAIEELIGILSSATPPRGKRLLSTMFMELVDRSDWPEYYEVIPEPRCIKGVQASVEKNRYKDASAAYTDLSLVFWNAMFYNEEGSQIASDAETLKSMLVAEWQKRPLLGAVPRLDPPPQSAQKVHGPSEPEPAPSTSAQTRSTTAIRANSAQAQPQRTASTPKPTPRAASPSSSAQDMDVDIGGSPDLDQPGSALDAEAEADRSADGDEEIVRQLERTMPRWEGFGEKGWMAEVGQDRLLEIVLAIKDHKDTAVGTRPAQSLEVIPEDSTSPNLSYQAPLSLQLIEGRARAGSYAGAQAFDLDVMRLFEKARRYYEPCTEPYGHVLLLQRLYQALTSSSPPAGPPYTSSTNFAFVRAGPGNARPLHSSGGGGGPSDGGGGNEGAAVTTFRVTTKDRRFVEEVSYKGLSVRLADWLHVANPDDPSRPIVGQVFKCWVSEEASRKGQPGVTVCWYYRPEQTFHPASRRFMEKEVFKTSHFADHPLEDIIEKIACQFTARHIRGRPKAPAWHPGCPLYVCDARYNDRERLFVRIKNWNSCVPEEVRKSDEFMPIAHFERLVYPRKLPSPFIVAAAAQSEAQAQEQGQGQSGPGQGLPQALAAKDKKAPGPGGIGESVERPAGAEVDAAGRRKPNRTRAQAAPQQPAQQQQQIATAQTRAAAVAATPMTPAQQAYYQPYVPTPGAAQALAAAQMQTQAQLQMAAAAAGAGSDRDRTMLGAAGTLSTPPVVEKLPSETTRHFECSPETGELLWFSAPPMNVPMAPGPRHSLAYLHFLAKKRKKAAAAEGNGEDENEDDADRDAEVKRRKTQVRPTAMESIQAATREIALERSA